MPRENQRPKETIFNLRVDPGLNAPFIKATDAEETRRASCSGLHGAYVTQQNRRTYTAEAGRQSLEAAFAARDPDGDKALVMREVEAELADPVFRAD